LIMTQRELVLNAKQLRVAKPTKEDLKKISYSPIRIILDNVWDTFNIGSFFRLADAVAAEKIYLCGKTVTPPNPKIHRASIGTWRWVPWEHYPSAGRIIRELKKEGHFVVAGEQTEKSIPYTKLRIKKPIALVVGHETRGVSKETLREVDQTIELPLLGINKSLNVLVAASVILYHWIDQFKRN